VLGAAAVALGIVGLVAATGPGRSQESQGEDKRTPIKVMPMLAIEPPRDVPAAQWKSPYCARWDDGCTECTRASRDDEPECRPADDYIGEGVCTPRGNLCYTAIDHGGYTELDSVCWKKAWISLARPGVIGIPPISLEVSSFTYDEKAGWLDNSIGLLAAETAKGAVGRLFASIGRNPETEFSLTDRGFIATLSASTPRDRRRRTE
jgi:hypothetical protein